MTNHPIRKYIKLSTDGHGSRWFDALGWIAYYFAQIEWASYEIISKLGTANQRTEGRELLYKKRSELAAALVAARFAPIDSQLASDWADFWRGAIAAAPKRNEILHNPLTVQMDGMPAADFADTEGIRLMKDPQQRLLGLGEVQAFSSEVRDLNIKMLELFKRSSL